MARVKQTAHKSTGGKAPQKHLITNPFKDRSNLKIVNFNFEKQITADFTCIVTVNKFQFAG